MPEERNAGSGLTEDVRNEDGSASVDTGSADGTIFDNMTPEELKAAALEKARQASELEKKLGQQGSELGELRKLREKLEMQNPMVEAVNSLKEFVAKKEEKPAFNYEAWEAQIIEKAQENPGEALREALRATSSWSAQDRQALEEKYEKRLSDMMARMDAMSEVVETTTDDYRENKELIEKLRKEGGLTMAKAKALAKDLRALMPAEQRTLPPSGINPTRVVRQEQVQKPYTQEDIDDLRQQGYDDVIIEQLKAKWERDAKLTEDQRRMF